MNKQYFDLFCGSSYLHVGGLLLLIVMAGTSLRAATIHVPRTPVSLYADGESSITIEVNQAGVPQSISFNDDLGTVIFSEIASNSPPAWLTPANWDMMRVTTRGTPPPTENLKARLTAEGAVIILR